MPKILRVITRLNVGGPAQQATGLSEGMRQLGWDTVLVSGQPEDSEGDMSYLLSGSSFRFVSLPPLRRAPRFFQDLQAFKKILRLLCEEQPQILHTHTAKAGALGRAAGQVYRLLTRRKLILVHTFHGHALEGYFGRTANWLFRRVEQLLALCTDCLIAVSPSVRQELLTLGIGSPSKVRVVSLGLPLEPLLKLPPPSFKSKLRIGVIGRLVPIKNHFMLLEAILGGGFVSWKEVPKFVIAGDGELRPQLAAKAHELGISRCIEFMGWQKEMAPLYAGLQMVCLTSKNEGTPVSLIEAMAAGRAIVATDVGGVGDLLGREERLKGKIPTGSFLACERGLLVRSGDAAALASGILHLAENPELCRQMGQKERQFAKGFLLPRLMEDLDQIYWELLRPGLKKILLVRNDRMGDLLMSLPALHEIRRALPEAKITLLVRKGIEPLLEGHPDLDRIMSHDERGEKGWQAIFRWAGTLRKERFDAVVILNPSRLFHVASALAGIRLRVGYSRKWGFLLNLRMPDTKSDRALHEASYNLELAHLIASPSGEKPSIHLFPAPRQDKEADELLSRNGVAPGARPIALHPWTSNPAKSWPLESFQELSRLLDKEGRPILLIGEPGTQTWPSFPRKRESDVVPDSIGDPRFHGDDTGIIDLTRQIPLALLPSVLKRCALLISNDSGPVHVASGVSTPALVLTPATHAKQLERWSPLGDYHQVMIDPQPGEALQSARRLLSTRQTTPEGASP